MMPAPRASWPGLEFGSLGAPDVSDRSLPMSGPGQSLGWPGLGLWGLRGGSPGQGRRNPQGRKAQPWSPPESPGWKSEPQRPRLPSTSGHPDSRPRAEATALVETPGLDVVGGLDKRAKETPDWSANWWDFLPSTLYKSQR